AAHPIYDFLNITCGISPASPGFKTVEIRPQPGELNHIKVSMPHKYGNIEVEFEKTGNEKLNGRINLPGKLSGKLFYNNKTYKLTEGINMISIVN
ncbi:MAG: alpha-L-rhamnosidase C-terminal domain-containing protein, partial [Mariniphaga sp.]|nr:alpha-L-rhamnosidase C-terminal domain-containing protein [Mariniphaga sp.]